MPKKFLGSDRWWRAAATVRRDSSMAREEVPPKSSRNSATTHTEGPARDGRSDAVSTVHTTGEEEDRRRPFDRLIAAV